MIAISIVSHGQKDLILSLLQDLERIRSPLIKQVLITHNVGDDRSFFPGFVGGARITHIVNVSKKGFGANHNAAFRLTSEPYFAVLNPDLRIEYDPFDLLLSGFETDSVGLVAPRILNVDGTTADSFRAMYTPLESLMSLVGAKRQMSQPVWIAGMFLLFGSSAYRAVKGFDEKFFMYVEDVDVCSRLVLSGRSLHVIYRACVTHDARRANRKSLQHFKWHLGSALKWWTSESFWRHWRLIQTQKMKKSR